MISHCGRVITLSIVVLSVLVSFQRAHSQTSEVLAARKQFATELSGKLLGSRDLFGPADANRGWMGVVLAPPGTSIAALSEAFNGYSGELIRSLTNSTAFDQPIEVRQGFGFFTPRPISTIWSDFLKRAMPINNVDQNKALELQASKWLFRPVRTKNGKGFYYSSTPSCYMTSYQNYEHLYSILVSGRGGDLWRLEPRLKRYLTYSDAEQGVMKDWVKRGYKSQIEVATAQLDAARTSPDWSNWAAAKAAFDNNQIPVDQDTRVSQTFLFPPPAAWSEVGSWLRLESAIPGLSPIRYQVARIKVVRPWMRIEAALDGSVRVNPQLAANSGYELSNGTVPTFEQMPLGLMPVYIDELILVRNIHNLGSPSEIQLSSHPLASFAYPDAINLVGFVVRVLPAIPPAPAPAPSALLAVPVPASAR